MERADDLVMKVLELGSQLLDAGDREPLAEDVKDVKEKCSAYCVAKRVADDARSLNILSAVEAQIEQETQRAFAMACKALDDKWTELMLSPVACACDASGKNCQHEPGRCENAAASAFCPDSKTTEEMQRARSGMCQECWYCGGVFREPGEKKPAQRGAVA